MISPASCIFYDYFSLPHHHRHHNQMSLSGQFWPASGLKWPSLSYVKVSHISCVWLNFLYSLVDLSKCNHFFIMSALFPHKRPQAHKMLWVILVFVRSDETDGHLSMWLWSHISLLSKNTAFLESICRGKRDTEAEYWRGNLSLKGRLSIFQS